MLNNTLDIAYAEQRLKKYVLSKLKIGGYRHG